MRALSAQVWRVSPQRLFGGLRTFALGDDSRVSERLRADQLKAFRQRAPVIALGSLVTVCLVVLMFWQRVPLSQLLSWAALLCLISSERLVYWWRQRQGLWEEPSASTSIMQAIGLSLAAGSLWGMAGWLLLPDAPVAHRMFVIFMTGGVAGAGATLLSPIPAAAIGLVLSSLLPLFLGVLVHGGELGLAIGAALLVYTIVLVRFCRLSFGLFADTVRADQERQSLLDWLTEAHGEIKTAYAQLESELNEARQTQEALLPKPGYVRNMEERYGLKISSHFEPSSMLGGDYWGMSPADETTLALCSADFSGHGVGAAINTFRLQALLTQFGPNPRDPGAFMQRVNENMCRLLPTGQFATLLCGLIDKDRDSFTYASAGAPPPMVFVPESRELLIGDNTGFPIGVTSGATYETRQLPFPPGAVLFLYSDALTETPNRQGEVLGDHGLAGILAEHLQSDSPATLAEEVLRRFYNSLDGPASDDLTVVSFWRTRPAAQAVGRGPQASAAAHQLVNGAARRVPVSAGSTA